MVKLCCPISLTINARLQIYDIAIKDYEEQIRLLKEHKNNFDYNVYRKKYVLLYNNKNNLKKSLEKIKDLEKSLKGEK